MQRPWDLYPEMLLAGFWPLSHHGAMPERLQIYRVQPGANSMAAGSPTWGCVAMIYVPVVMCWEDQGEH